MSEDVRQGDGLSRRTVLKRGAVVGGALVWATPVVQSIGSSAFASTGSETTCTINFSAFVDGNLGFSGVYASTSAKCCSELATLEATYNAATGSDKIIAFAELALFVTDPASSECAKTFQPVPA